MKHNIQLKENIPIDQQRLIFNGKLLVENEKTLKEYYIQKEQVLTLILK